MPKKNPYRPFTPHEELIACLPETSGNEINGLGEAAFRRPRMVYWSSSQNEIEHADLQNYFYKRSAQVPAFTVAREERLRALEFPMPDVSDTALQQSPDDWTASLNQFVADGWCDMIGVAEMCDDWVFEGNSVSQSRIIVLGVEHDYDNISQAPEAQAGLEVVEQYKRAAVASKRIAAWLHENGWAAEAVTGPMTGKVTLIPPALACGFGELGKHGSLINKEFGASFRLSAVLTDAPFKPTPPREFGVDGFCANCRICEDACPPEAISPDKKTVRGAEKWYVDFDKCISFFNETHGCAICIAECPWSRPGIGLNLAEKLARKSK
ncbi:MAG: 4Fe-4S dicluster domain-containing protein [Pseudomonadota bacterium]